MRRKAAPRAGDLQPRGLLSALAMHRFTTGPVQFTLSSGIALEEPVSGDGIPEYKKFRPVGWRAKESEGRAMVKLYENGVFLLNGTEIVEDDGTGEQRIAALAGRPVDRQSARQGTISHSILKAHNVSGSMEKLQIRFDSLTAHDISYVNIIQTAKASGLERFPMPFVLTNCHNSLGAVGGTINGDDHIFGLSAARKYGGIYVPPHMAVIHMYMRETMAGCGRMILGGDSHTRYGALGTMAVGEGGGELVKQLLGQTYDVDYPRVVAVCLTGRPMPGVGPQDVALALIAAVFDNGFVKNSILEFVGEGIASLPTDFRCGIDVMTTETACLSSIWRTDGDTRNFLEVHGRQGDYRELKPQDVAYYDRMVYVDLSSVKPMIALPFHPSRAWEIEVLNENAGDIFREIESSAAEIIGCPGASLNLSGKITAGQVRVDQGIIAGCAGGTFSNILAASSILKGGSTGNGGFSLSIYPSSQPVMLAIVRQGIMADLLMAGVTVRTAFCGPCFGAGDVPPNNSLSIRHTTRNFPNREGSKPAEGQMASVALMDARSIAATAAKGGILTPATALVLPEEQPVYHYDDTPYRKRVYCGFGAADPGLPLVYGPNIADWPEMPSLPKHLLLKIVSFITDPVTTTDELIPSGETASYRSNPLRLAEFTLSRKDPAYVGRAKEVRAMEILRAGGTLSGEASRVLREVRDIPGFGDLQFEELGIASAIYAERPGDGSAREQAASCQRVLGGGANFAREYATKRYRSNLINWGMIPFVSADCEPAFTNGSFIFVPEIREAIRNGLEHISAWLMDGKGKKMTLHLSGMTRDERSILLAGSLINFNRRK